MAKNKKVSKALSEHFRKLGRKSWAARKKKILEQAKKVESKQTNQSKHE